MRMRQVRYYYPRPEALSDGLLRRSVRQHYRALQPFLRTDLFGRRLCLGRRLVAFKRGHHRLRLRRHRHRAGDPGAGRRGGGGAAGQERSRPSEAAADCDAMMNQYARIGAPTIAAMRQCRVIARYGVGVDIVDVEAATAKGILVTNVRDYCTEEVADHAIALWLRWRARSPHYDRATHQGVWHWQSGQPVYRLRGQTCGIVSFGRIGQAIARTGREPSAWISWHTTHSCRRRLRPPAMWRRSERTSFSPRSDVIFMQVPMTPETRHFLGSREFRLMQARAPSSSTPGAARPSTIIRSARGASSSGKVAGGRARRPRGGASQAGSWSPLTTRCSPCPMCIVTPARRLLFRGIDPPGSRDGCDGGRPRPDRRAAEKSRQLGRCRERSMTISEEAEC